jgi:hypothetical protein
MDQPPAPPPPPQHDWNTARRRNSVMRSWLFWLLIALALVVLRLSVGNPFT